jgi:hypothetical protein
MNHVGVTISSGIMAWNWWFLVRRMRWSGHEKTFLTVNMKEIGHFEGLDVFWKDNISES